MLSVNRMAVIVSAKRPFLDWLHSVDPTSHDLTLCDLNDEPTAYLLPESGSDEEAVRQVRRFCKEILTAELDGWWRQRSDWPENLNFGLFKRWFEWQYHSVVLDLATGPLIREGA
jgi:hypothetical protein